MSQSIQIVVRYSSQAYNCRVGKVTASSTSSPLYSAERLAEKLFGPSVQDVHLIAKTGLCDTAVVTYDDDLHAFCWANGLIDFSTEIPAYACHFATGPDRALRAIMGVLARHGKGASAGSLLVPGVPEAPTQAKAMDALIAFEEWVRPRNGTPGSYRVKFGRPCRLEGCAA